MNDLEDALRRQVAYGPRRAPVSPTDAVDAAADSHRIRLLLALADDPALHAEWARRIDYDSCDRIGKAVWLRAETEAVDREVDERLEKGDRETLELLARMELPWRHDELDAAVRRSETRRSAAMILAGATPGRLRSAVLECEVVDDVVEMLRAAAVVGSDELWEQFLIWHGRLEELEADDRDAWLADLEGTGASLDPTLYGRGLLSGDYDAEWLRRSRPVADFLQVYGPSDWLEVLASLEFAADDASELAATLAVSASLGIGDDPPAEDEVDSLLDLLAEEPAPDRKESPWEPLATRLGFGVQVALGGEAFGLLLAQAAAHERLVTHGIHSPGIRGLPLSATGDQHLEADAVERVVEAMAEDSGDDGALVAAVRTLYDGGVWARRGDADVRSICETVADAFEAWTHGAVEMARGPLLAAMDPSHLDWEREQFEASPELPEAMVLAEAGAGECAETVAALLAERAGADESVAALDAMRRLGTMEADSALDVLADLWLSDASVYRAPFARDLLREAVAVGVEEPDAN